MHEQKLKELRQMVLTQDISKIAEETEFFRGADIIVSDDPGCPDSNGWSVYTKVVTPFAKEVSWLLIQLRDTFSDKLDYMNKYFFFGTLAQAANDSMAAGKVEKTDLLASILNAAETIEL